RFRALRLPRSFPTRRSSDLPTSLPLHHWSINLNRLLPIMNPNDRDNSLQILQSCHGQYNHALNESRSWSLLYLSWSYEPAQSMRSEEHTSELQSRENLVCRL